MTLVLIGFLVVILGACSTSGKFEGIDEDMQTLGREAVRIADEYLDNRIDADTATNQIEELDYVHLASTTEGLENEILTYIFLLEARLSIISVNEFLNDQIDPEDLEQLLERRNMLAEGLGMDSR